MASKLEARLTRLEANSDHTSEQFVVVGDEAEHNELMRARRIQDGAVVIVTGVCRATRTA